MSAGLGPMPVVVYGSIKSCNDYGRAQWIVMVTVESIGRVTTPCLNFGAYILLGQLVPLLDSNRRIPYCSRALQTSDILNIIWWLDASMVPTVLELLTWVVPAQRPGHNTQGKHYFIPTSITFEMQCSCAIQHLHTVRKVMLISLARRISDHFLPVGLLGSGPRSISSSRRVG